MKVRCIYNAGKALRPFETKTLQKLELGRFGSTVYTEYGEVRIGEEYLVMGLIIFETYQAFLVDDNGLISTCPCQLFEVIDTKVNSKWHYRLIERGENIYPFVQAILGYYELCYDKKAYENLIVEKEEEAQRTYFKRKIELENEFAE